MPSREENRLIVEKRIYDAAIGLFCELGYKKTTLIDIAQEAGVSTRTLYKYFPTKESILRKFGRDNILRLKSYASELPFETSLKDRVLDIMVYDFMTMFCEMDVSYILHSARDEEGMYARFEIENVLTAESIYCNVFKKEQMRRGVQPNESVALCASVVMALYRHCNDLYRFKKTGTFDKKDLREFYDVHLSAIWDSLYETLMAEPPEGYLARDDSRHLFSSADD